MYLKSSFRESNPIQAASMGSTPAQHRLPADVVLIVGPNQDFKLAFEAQRQCAEGELDTDVIGNAHSPIQLSDLTNLRRSGRLGPDTHVFFIAHGNKEPAGHALFLSDEQTPTKQVISALREPLEGVPPWTGPLHLLACEEGALLDEIHPGSDLWKAGPMLLYGGTEKRPMDLHREDVPEGIGFVARCKKLGIPASGIDSFANLANWTGEDISIIGGDLQKPLTVHAPKTMDHVMPDSLQAELRSSKVQQELDEKIHSRVVGTAKDLDKLDVAVEKHKGNATGTQDRVLTMLHIQADRGEPKDVEKLLDAHPEFLENKSGVMGRTPLRRACTGGNLPVVKLLLERGADPNETTLDGRSPLWIALESKDLEMVKLLCRYGADPHRIGRYGKSVHEFALTNKQTEVLQAMDEESSRYTTLGKPSTTTQARL